MKIRAATSDDIPRLIEVERASSGAAHWSEQHYRAAIDAESGGPERLVLVAEISSPAQGSENVLAGFSVARRLSPEWELENIVVAPDVRRQGIAAQLLEALLLRARETNSESVFLEVRESNAPARALYENAGFRMTGRRQGYYSTPAEDAILYRLALL